MSNKKRVDYQMIDADIFVVIKWQLGFAMYCFLSVDWARIKNADASVFPWQRLR